MAEYSPFEVAEMIGVSADNLRDWRRRGFLDEVGKSAERGWKYSVADILALWVGVLQGAVNAFEDAKVIAILLITEVTQRKVELPLAHYDYAPDEIDLGDACLFIAHPSYGKKNAKVLVLRSLNDAPREFLRAEVINLAAFFHGLPPELREAVFTVDMAGERSGKEGAKSLAKHRPQDGRN
ncbi:MAG: MerR family transcriptional regulator [Pseudomonadota bacterium]